MACAPATPDATTPAAATAAHRRGSRWIATADADVTITTPDGTCDAYFVHPADGAHAAVLVWPDIFGLRPAFRADGQAAGRGPATRSSW